MPAALLEDRQVDAVATEAHIFDSVTRAFMARISIEHQGKSHWRRRAFADRRPAVYAPTPKTSSVRARLQ
jgi:hypothetical protein